eukprot:CAMPEP_0119087178 /NCGR_PEP_ID=MMETSP1178-20130426/140678_1 /TAXON_ID=33656 /ORGANISM="unid sp, Strain CCMP2000" /LENGTH=49 /DNA_ID= /DNA_START= /DNA_END= /DNA_ORIENTATION=
MPLWMAALSLARFQCPLVTTFLSSASSSMLNCPLVSSDEARCRSRARKS